jgi:hypothetical protein
LETQLAKIALSQSGLSVYVEHQVIDYCIPPYGFGHNQVTFIDNGAATNAATVFADKEQTQKIKEERQSFIRPWQNPLLWSVVIT